MLKNIDALEIEKFTFLADLWWDRNGEFKALHDINPVRSGYVIQRAQIARKKVVDAGCGGGLLSEAMAKAGAYVTGIDMSARAVAVAGTHAKKSGLDIGYHVSSAEQWGADHAQNYDVVTCMELVEHVPDPALLVRACAGLLKPGGHLFFATVNRTWLARLLVIWVSEYILRIVPKGTHQYDKFVKPEELAFWGEKAGMTLAHYTGLRYIPIFAKSSLCKDLNLNYLMHFKKQNR
ncbi:MAG: bifunctional 2-polyprenyl-6-hydroxyphenol methylase/3-demethylubiquinol 3-O-methyltransferase UbiG [Desulfobacteraceae bacterium]|nr:bifunctional 2-polyprenyl-6-hydroxyphenol methylase/3-demethylubiquinol 3-O-methyltransferase UbiG [Desulfobacteraceae bacterium]